LLGVHLWGTPCDVDGLARLAVERSWTVIYDAAQALGSRVGDRHVGSFGAAEVFSLHATKLCNAFEGGVVTTNDADLAAELARARNFGFDEEGSVSGLGINAKMTEVSAAMGLVSLDALDDFASVHRSNHQRYDRGLAHTSGVTVRAADGTTTPTQPYVVAEVAPAAGLTRDEVLAVLQAENVLARRYFFPGCHRVLPYRDEPATHPVPLPVTERALERVLVLPTGTATPASAIERICEVIDCATRHPDEVRAELRAHAGTAT
jgi:dTDP-4-amino-4,6-dideoxyglucose